MAPQRWSSSLSQGRPRVASAGRCTLAEEAEHRTERQLSVGVLGQHEQPVAFDMKDPAW